MWKALYKKEICSFFYNRSIYSIISIFLILSTVVATFFGEYFIRDNSSMYSFFIFLPQILILIIPAFTTHIWADEAKNKTLELLFTYPLSDFTLVSAKFCAVWTLLVLMIISSLPLAFFTAYYIDVDVSNIISAYIGTILVATFLSALNGNISALILAPIPTYLTSILCGWIFISLNFSLPEFIIRLCPNIPFYINDIFSLNTHYQNFINGYLGLDDIFFFIISTFILVVFNWVIIKEKRSGK